MADQETQLGVDDFQTAIRKRRAARTRLIVIVSAVVVLAAAGVIYLLTRPNLADRIVIPYIAHQKPAVDPHLPNPNQLADKLDEVLFDGLFNLSATPSGVIYEDGLGEMLGIDENNVVSVRLKSAKRWHNSWRVTMDDDDVSITPGTERRFSAADLAFTLRRIQTLGSLSPDWILVSQAIDPIAFDGPDESGIVRFTFKGDRIWKEADIKEVLSFKILPDGSPMNALNYTVGTASYIELPPQETGIQFEKVPGGGAHISRIVLAPFVDNSTYTTELRNGSINVLLDTPFGSLSPILEEQEEFFAKSNVSTTFFALLFNTQRLTHAQRVELRRLVNARTVADRFFRVGTPQQREIIDYRGRRNNYGDYINRSVFPSSSYYIEEEVVEPFRDDSPPDLTLLPDTVRVRASINYGFREELSDLLGILNDPAVSRGKIQALAVSNDDIARGNYDAVLIPITGYRSNFLFDLYDIFLREPNFEAYRINLATGTDSAGVQTILPQSLVPERNFCRIDATVPGPEQESFLTFLSYVHGFMATRMVGDRQEYARRVDAAERELALGSWLFSLPSLAYFSTQMDSASIDLYGVASQLSTIDKWRERPEQ